VAPLRGTALLVIDLINPLDFEGADALFERALPAARASGQLMGRARASGVPVIVVNDAFGSNAGDLKALAEHFRRRGGRAGALLDPLSVDAEVDHFVAKPHHSGFYRTDLEDRLHSLGADRVVLTGIAADICVLATAFDAHMRDFAIAVPSDCTSAETEEAEDFARRHAQRVFDADTRPSRDLSLRAVGSVA
jgi:nicotinamidase-related amidase